MDRQTGERRQVPCALDESANRIEVTLPVDPGTDTWRHYAVTGVWDAEAHEFARVGDHPTANGPGGANGATPPPVFNVAFRTDEPVEPFDLDPSEVTPPTPLGRGYYREHAQAMALAERDVSEFHADVDFGALTRGEVDRPSPTEPGYHSRLYGSRFDLGEGIDMIYPENGPHTTRGFGRFLNRVQPYSLYVPTDYDPERSHPLVVYFHGGGGSYNGLGLLPGLCHDLGEDRSALVLGVGGRGPRTLFEGAGELDVIEALADVNHHYNVDLDRVALCGFSMGGYGAFSLATKYPDLVAGVVSISDGGIGISADFAEHLENLRHVPVLLRNGFEDDLSTHEVFLGTEAALRDRGYRHELDATLSGTHFSPLLRDEWPQVRAFLDGATPGQETVTRSPARVTYRRFPAHDVPEFGLVHDGAYWVEDIRISNYWNQGHVDVRCRAAGRGSPTPDVYGDVGTEPDEYVALGTRWEPAPEREPRNELAIDLEHVTRLGLALDETAIDPERPIRLDVTTTDPAELRLRSRGRERTIEVPVGTTTHEIGFEDGD